MNNKFKIKKLSSGDLLKLKYDFKNKSWEPHSISSHSYWKIEKSEQIKIENLNKEFNFRLHQLIK